MRRRRTRARVIAITTLLACLLTLPAAADDAVFQIFDEAVIQWDKLRPERIAPDGFVLRHAGHRVSRTLDLPPAPVTTANARRIIATVRADPVYTIRDGRRFPNDPWTRLGTVTVEVRDDEGLVREAEIMRFITPYGASAVFEQDVTALAPLLAGTVTINGAIASYSDEPGWRLSVELRYCEEGAGHRRPTFAFPVFTEPRLHAEMPRLLAEVTVPSGLDPPRLRVISTGHATDGEARHEFVSCPHVLRIDGVEVARWRPWSEFGGVLRAANPTGGRLVIGGREIRASDLDRSGWHPGLVVEPLLIPVPELTPGRHEIEIEVLGIRPKDPPDEKGKEHHGYWSISVIAVADRAWGVEADGR
ncbi:MAG: hypothetical protein HKO59_17080 [Phycisphaerales bacterium]|nr:hypothetical protein [Phycisphaerae bacterium]NNF44027.1 hypothetical protein [Phycisphaerales bacterium]NNM27664.1 hypothetical protein [Phycisphaerales bacterium]